MTVVANLFDDAALAAIRADQEDPLIMYFVVRESLNMSPGKIAVQVAHSSQMILLHYYKAEPSDETMTVWLNTSFRKGLLRADDKEWEKIKGSEIRCWVVKDAGLTEVAQGSETVLVLWPMLKSQRPKLIKRLRLL